MKTLYELAPGEYVDLKGAFERHTGLFGEDEMFDIIIQRGTKKQLDETMRYYEEVLTGLEFTIEMSSANMLQLIKILNAAPVNGEPTND
ncbi:hypothetical protein [Rothia mucilaginosa]